MEELGHDVIEAVPETSWDSLGSAYATAMLALVAHDVETLASAAGRGDASEALEPTTRLLAEAGRRLAVADVLSALESFAIARRDLGGFFRDFDVLLLPANPRVGVRIGETVSLDGRQSAQEVADGWRQFEGLYLFNVTGGPAISLPVAMSEDGLPIGIQLAADVGREDVLLKLGAQLEGRLPWKDRVPRVHAGSPGL
jgi:amidase